MPPGSTHSSRFTPIQPLPGSADVITRIGELITGLRPDAADMLTAFHRIQHEFGYVPREAIPLLAGQFRTTPAAIYGTIQFYSEVRTEPPARTTVEWCSGPACLLKGSANIRRALEAVLGCPMNGATADREFGLRLVQCAGTCHLTPLVRLDGRYICPPTVSEAIELARGIRGDGAGGGEAGTGEQPAPVGGGEAAGVE